MKKDSERIKDIIEAIDRYSKTETKAPEDLISELSTLIYKSRCKHHFQTGIDCSGTQYTVCSNCGQVGYKE